MGVLNKIVCRHEWVFDRNIYGDEINCVSGKRSWWRCQKCGRYRLDPHLYLDLERKGRKS